MPFKKLLISSLLFTSLICSGQVTIKSSKTQDGIPYATISFGNGQGVFADDEGVFIFTEKLYPDVDTLFVTSLGYKNVIVPTSELSDTILMDEEVSQLNEVVLVADNRKFSEETLKPYLDDDYYHCWLPTIESEIAVFFRNPDADLKKLSTVHFPITLESKDWEKRKRKNAEKKPFSTLFKVKFYENNNGLPGQVLTYENIVFRATEKNGDVHNLDVSEYNITFPENGFFVSLQVLGYTDAQGKLLPNKKYKEIKSKNGIVKIPTNFRPLLPFTSEIPEHRTYIKRVFINGNNWVQFRKGNIESGLFSAGLNNYGIGISYKVYNDE
ncbi:peptidase associated/transthyretin-like domain-containing protein [Hanstruepera flava]|uniref:hypothetical protein n=1 Tax=Hanstruepera flava TaxID=2930218 RepID=UPI002027D558|nr:hypothetical protein [Hanstruepera flava]